MNFAATLLLSAFSILLMMPSLCTAKVSVTSGLTLENKASAGDTYKQEINLKNSDSTPQEVKLYQTDYLFYADGSNLYNDPGTDPGSNANWITFSPQRLVIPPGGNAKVELSITVPSDLEAMGTFWSMLMVEGISPVSAESSTGTAGKPGMSLGQVVRYGVQIISDVGHGAASELQFSDPKIVRKSDKRLLQIDLENTGQKWLRPALWVELYDSTGALAGRFDAGKARLFPTTSARFHADLTDIPSGEYQAMVIADCGEDDLFGASYTLLVMDP